MTIKFWSVPDMKVVKSVKDDIVCSVKIAHGHLFSGTFKNVKVGLILSSDLPLSTRVSSGQPTHISTLVPQLSPHGNIWAAD